MRTAMEPTSVHLQERWAHSSKICICEKTNLSICHRAIEGYKPQGQNLWYKPLSYALLHNRNKICITITLNEGK